MKRVVNFVMASAGIVLLVSSISVAASQMQEVYSTYGGNGFFNWEINSAVAYDKGRRRNDTENKRLFHSTPDQRIDIERNDLDKRWAIDPKHKRYTEESISEAVERMRKEMEKADAEWAKEEKKQQPQKTEEPEYRIKSAKTTTQGPGAAVDINGFSSRPYVIKTEIVYEGVKDPSKTFTQQLYSKVWTTDSSKLAKYHQDEQAYWQSMAKNVDYSSFQNSQFVKQMQASVLKAQKDAKENPWFSQTSTVAKITGHPVRTISVFTMGHVPGESMPAKEEAKPDDESVVQPGDISGDVGGMLSGVASRWASKKANQKIQAKMAEHPAWVDDVNKDLSGDMVGWGYMTEVKSVMQDVPASLFEVPAGFKKVKSL